MSLRNSSGRPADRQVTTQAATALPGWRRAARAPAAEKLSFKVCAKQQNLDALKRKALDVSTPGSAAYGQYLSVEAVDELTAPAPEDLATVEAWLRAHDVSFSRNRACFEAALGAQTTFAVASKGDAARYLWSRVEGRRGALPLESHRREMRRARARRE